MQHHTPHTPDHALPNYAGFVEDVLSTVDSVGDHEQVQFLREAMQAISNSYGQASSNPLDAFVAKYAGLFF